MAQPIDQQALQRILLSEEKVCTCNHCPWFNTYVFLCYVLQVRTTFPQTSRSYTDMNENYFS